MRESAIEERLRKEVEKAGGLCLKMPAELYRGIPDRLVLLPGPRVFFIETKQAKKKPSLHQKRFLTILCTLGLKSLIISGPSDLQTFVETQCLKPNSTP